MNKKQIVKDIARYAIPKIGKAVQDQVIPKVIEQLPKVKTKVSDIIASRKAGNVLEDITAVVPIVAAVTVADDVVEAVAVEPERPGNGIVPKVLVGVAVAGAVVVTVVTIGKVIQAIGQHGSDEEEVADDEVESAACTADDDVERAIFTAIANKIA